jgi:hypothetical protein
MHVLLWGLLGLRAGDLNTHRFVGSSPIDAADPSGLFSFWNLVASTAQTVGGGAEIAAGVGVGIGVGWTGIGLVPAGALIAHGSDTTWAGLRGIYAGEPRRTYTAGGVTWAGRKAGLSQGTAEVTGDVVDFAIPIVAGGWGSAAAKKAAACAAAPNSRGIPRIGTPKPGTTEVPIKDITPTHPTPRPGKSIPDTASTLSGGYDVSQPIPVLRMPDANLKDANLKGQAL